LTACVVAVVVVFVALPAATAMIAAFVTVVAAASLAALAQQQIGGQTGDVLGAVEQVCEVTVLMTLAARVVQV
jgi:adenosylcobinamide-GDP ribazoletransferase